MLHQNVLMADIDVDQWRNTQALLLRSAKSRPRLVVLHEAGRVVKFRHTRGVAVNGRVEQFTDPHQLARALYRANSSTVDFVVVMERDSVDSYFAQIQDAWNIEDDLDVFVQKTYAAMDSYPDGIVTYPGPARSTLGLQWRVGASRDQVEALVRTIAAPNTTLVLGTTDHDRLWASLILDIDDDLRVSSITTADPSKVDLTGGHQALAYRLTEWVAESGRKVSVTLVLELAAAQELLDARYEDKAALLARLATEGRATLARP